MIRTATGFAVGRVTVPVFALLAAGCGTPVGTPAERPVVLTSVPPMAYFVERLGDGLVDVEVLIPPGANPVVYEPSIAQMRAAARAIMYVKVGHPNFPFEATWLDELSAVNQGMAVVDGSRGCAGRRPPRLDPHIWLAPSCARTMARHIADALIARLPGRAATVRSRLVALLAEVDALDAELRSSLAGHVGQRFLVFHPAWGHFADDYGLEQIAIEHGAKEPSSDHLVDVIHQARAEGLRVVLVQPQFDRRSAEVVAAEIDGTVLSVDPLSKDWPDTLRRAARAFRGAPQP